MKKMLAIDGGSPIRIEEFPTKQYRFSENVANEVKKIVLAGRTHYDSGEHVKKFEKEFSQYIGTKHALATTSGTSSLQLAIHALGIGPGDEVIIPSYTFIAVAQAVLVQGAIPVFVDLDETYNISLRGIKKAITKKTRAIIVVHMFGNVAQVKEICKLAKKEGLKVIEDCAQAVGIEYNGKKGGSIGDIGCFSFNIKKTIPIGEGGMLVTSNNLYAKRAAEARGTGLDKTKEEVVCCPGYTAFMTEMQAVLGRAALKDIDKTNRKRRQNAKILLKGLLQLHPFIELPTILRNTRPTFSRIAFRINESKFLIKRDDFLEAVKKEGIPFKKFYPRPLYTYKLFRGKRGFGSTKFPFYLNRKIDYRKMKCHFAERFCREQIAIEFSPYLKREDVNDIIRALQKVVAHYKRLDKTFN